MPVKPHAPSCDRNRDPILAVLREHFADRRSVLEIGSGTGQHAVYFAAAMPWLQWQCTDLPGQLPGIRAWLDEAGLPNTPPPQALDASGAWSAGAGSDAMRSDGHGSAPVQARQAIPPAPRDAPRHDAMFSANTLHIMGWPAVRALFAGLDQALADDAVVVVYGPFNDDGQYTSDSNREFDAWLKARDPVSGIRDFEAVDALARDIGLRLLADVAMPANNRCLVWRRP